MNDLSDQQVLDQRDDAEMMRRRHLWPLRSRLPLTRPLKGANQLGFLARADEGEIIVHLGVIYDEPVLYLASPPIRARGSLTQAPTRPLLTVGVWTEEERWNGELLRKVKRNGWPTQGSWRESLTILHTVTRRMRTSRPLPKTRSRRRSGPRSNGSTRSHERTNPQRDGSTHRGRRRRDRRSAQRATTPLGGEYQRQRPRSGPFAVLRLYTSSRG
jgi:hypothetical protein